MKKISLALAALLGFAVLTPATAEAHGCRTRVTYDNCGACLNWEYVFAGRDCYGCPVYRWVVVSRTFPRVDYSCGRGGYGRGCEIHISGGYRGHGRYSDGCRRY